MQANRSSHRHTGLAVWHRLARQFEAALRHGQVDAMESLLGTVASTRDELSAVRGRDDGERRVRYSAVRAQFFAMLAPICTRTSEAFNAAVASRLVRGPMLAPDLVSKIERRKLATAQDIIGMVWREHLPPLTAQSTVDAWNELAYTAPGQSLQREAQLSLELLNEVTRERHGTTRMHKEVLLEVHRQLQSGLTFGRKLVEVAPRVYALHGIAVTTSTLARLVYRSEFPLSIALQAGTRPRQSTACSPAARPRAIHTTESR